MVWFTLWSMSVPGLIHPNDKWDERSFFQQPKIKYIIIKSSLDIESTFIVYLMHAHNSEPHSERTTNTRAKVNHTKLSTTSFWSQTKNKHNRATHKRMPMHFIRIHRVSCCIPFARVCCTMIWEAALILARNNDSDKTTGCGAHTGISIATARTAVVVSRYQQSSQHSSSM